MNRKLPIVAPAAPAAIMALGIFLMGAIYQWPHLDAVAGVWMALVTIALWSVMNALLVWQCVCHATFRRQLLAHDAPVMFFSSGTWVAAVSVLCNVANKYFPALHAFIQWSAGINVFFWGVFIVISLYKFIPLLQKNSPVHGVLLLTTVSTQSIVVMLAAVFTDISGQVLFWLVITGLVFYVVSVCLIVRRYLCDWQWSLIQHWHNSNCIIHGALSISGVAMVVSKQFTLSSIVYCWIAALLLLLCIESIEVLRLYHRVKYLGFTRGIGIFDVSQWSRNFTFGMFYLLSYQLLMMVKVQESSAILAYATTALMVWGYVVLLFLCGEIGYFLLANRVHEDGTLKN